MTSDRRNSLTYADAGVDIDAGNALVERIKPAARSTSRPGVMDGLGGFGALFDLKAAGYEDPILVAATDGVGTKLRIAIETGHVGSVGVDLVAMCVNDLVCQGAEPLFFLDYFATGKLSVDAGSAVVEGIAEGCRQAGCALIGGETAEMPGMYVEGDFDLAGFAMGAMERGQGLPNAIQPGDVLVGLPSNGVHSNGYSLVRKIVESEGLSWDAPAPFEPERALGEALLEPTAIYVRQVLPLVQSGTIRALAHITGGGLSENLPRVLPKGLGADIDLSSWTFPEVFRWLAHCGGLDTGEALRTFNCGIGMIAVVAEADVARTTASLAEVGLPPIMIGRVSDGEGFRVSGSLL